MSGHFDFGNNLDIPLRRVFYDFAHLVLREYAAVRRTVVCIVLLVFADDGFTAHGTDSGELGIFLYLDSPALVVGKVPMETVDFVE